MSRIGRLCTISVAHPRGRIIALKLGYSEFEIGRVFQAQRTNEILGVNWGEISTNILGKAEGEPNKSPSNLVQEPSGSIPQPAEDNMVGKGSPVECIESAGVFPASPSAPFFDESYTPDVRWHPLGDDVESYPVINGKDDGNAWQPKTGSSPDHPLSAGRKICEYTDGAKDFQNVETPGITKLAQVLGRLRFVPSPRLQMSISADSDEEPGMQFCSHTSLHFIISLWSSYPKNSEVASFGVLGMRLLEADSE